MAVTTFAAIDVGSYNVSMEIFEIGGRSGLKSLNRIRTRLELGADTFNLKKISVERMQELIVVLNDYKHMMDEYRVSGYRACAKSALREARNRSLVLEAVYRSTGIRIDILSNAEQRFLGYKSIASSGTSFREFIQKGTAIIDLGGGSVQVSLFDEEALVSTANMPLGSLRVREYLSDAERMARHYDELVEEYIDHEIRSFKRLYLKERKITNVILVGDYFTNLIFQNRSDLSKFETREEFNKWYETIIRKSPKELGAMLGVDSEIATVVIPSAVLYRRLIEELGADMIWLPGIQLTDGIAFDYAHRSQLIKSKHNFEQDILMAARHMAEKFSCDCDHVDTVIKIADAAFDAVKKVSGLTPREKLLMNTAAYLYDCGRYISSSRADVCSYEIITSTEIIGLSQTERGMIGGMALYHAQPFAYFEEDSVLSNLDMDSYMIVAKLTAIMRLATALDFSHKQKAEKVSCALRNNCLIFQIETREDFLLESDAFEKQKLLFEEIFGYKVKLKVVMKRGR